jgi:hypothetical protein
MAIITMKAEKAVSAWSNKDFVIYFATKLDKEFSSKFSIPAPAWQGFMSRMKGFRVRSHLESPEAYKEFVDKVFAVFFTKKDYIPSFGAVCSLKVYNVIKSIKSTSTSSGRYEYSNEDFEKLKRAIYGDTSLFEAARSTVDVYNE